MARERITITDLNSYGIVDEADSVNVKENAMVACMNQKFKNGRIVPAIHTGTQIGTSLYGTSTYNTCKIWPLLNGQNVYVSASDKMEYHWYDSETSAYKKYPLPDWFGGLGKATTGTSGTTIVMTGDNLGGTYDTGYDKFFTENSNPAKNLNKQASATDKDVVFFSKMVPASMQIDESFGTSGTLDPAKWTTITGTPTVSVGLTCSGGGAKSTTELDYINNRVFYINNIAITTPSAGNAYPAGFLFFNKDTGLGYIVCITQKNLTAYPATTHTEYRMRVYCGYVAGETTYGLSTTLFSSSLLIYDETIFDTTEEETEDSYTRYNDLFGFIQGPWLNIGYGRKIQASIPIEISFLGSKVIFGFVVDANATLGPAVAGADGWNVVSTGILSPLGPYPVTKVVDSATDPYVVFTSGAGTISLNDRGFIWGCHSVSPTDQVIRPSSEYLLRLTSDEPLRCYYGGISPSTFPNRGEPTYYPTFCAWGGNDVAIFNGRVFLGGARLYARVIHVADGTGNLHYRWKEIAGYPTRVMWNVPYDIEDWTSALSGWIENVDSSGKVTACRPLRDVLMVYKTDSIFRLTPTGDSVTPFSISTYSRSIGVPRARAVGDVGMSHFFTWNSTLWEVNSGDMDAVTSLVRIDSDYIVPLACDNIVVCCLGTSASYGMNGKIFDYKGRVATEINTIHKDIDTNGKYWMAVTASGTAYQSEIANLPKSLLSITGLLEEDEMHFITPHLSFGDPTTNKTVYSIDVIYKVSYYVGEDTPDVAWDSGPVTVYGYVEGTSIGSPITPTPELIGYCNDSITQLARYKLYRVRALMNTTGVLFQFKIAVGKGTYASYPTYNVTPEIIRMEFDIERGEADQKTGSV